MTPIPVTVIRHAKAEKARLQAEAMGIDPEKAAALLGDGQGDDGESEVA